MTIRKTLKDVSTYLDNWQNPVTGLGTLADKRTAGTFEAPIPLTAAEIAILYRYDPLAARICELPAKECTREWVRFTKDTQGSFSDISTDLEIQRHTFEAMKWSRAYGGAVNILGVQDGKKQEQELDLSRAKEIKFITTLDSTQCRVTEKYNNPLQPYYNQPKMFEIYTGGYNQRVHASRVIRWDGVPLPPSETTVTWEWGDSVLNRVKEAVRDFAQANHAVALLVSDFSQPVIKIKGLAGMMASDKDGALIKRLQVLNFCRSVMRLVPLDAQHEDFARVSTPTSGLTDLVHDIATYLATVTGIPLTLLLGVSPAGLNATGEGDHRNFQNQIRSEQTWVMKPRLARLFNIIANCSAYRLKSSLVNKHVPFVFSPLYLPSEKEIADTRLAVAKADEIHYNLGTLSSADIATHWSSGSYSIDVSPDTAVTRDTEVKSLSAKTAEAASVAADAAAKAMKKTPTKA